MTNTESIYFSEISFHTRIGISLEGFHNSGEPEHPIFVKHHLVDPIELDESPLIEITDERTDIPGPINLP